METQRTPSPEAPSGAPDRTGQNAAPATVVGWVRTAPLADGEGTGDPMGPWDEAAVPADVPTAGSADPAGEEPGAEPQDDPPFVLYKEGEDFGEAVEGLALWVHGLLLPVYGREISSTAPWCPRWYDHMEAVAQLYGLWMAWQDLTGSRAPLTGPAMWHRDFLTPAMNTLRDPSGVFAGCKPGQHRAKESPPIEEPAPDAPPPTT